ncbi:ABC transporter permease [Hutsoniella sourekii]
MANLILTNIKRLFRNKGFFIWMLVFPFAYITIYSLALGNLEDPESYQIPPIEVAVTSEGDYQSFTETLESLGAVPAKLDGEKISYHSLNEDLPIAYIVVDRSKALHLLDSNVVSSVVTLGEKAQIETIDSQQLSVQIIKNILKSYELYQNTYRIFQDGFQQGDIPIAPYLGDIPGAIASSQRLSYNDIAQEIKANLTDRYESIKSFDPATHRQEAISMNKMFFFACLGYIAFFFMSAGQSIVEDISPEYSGLGIRNEISPTPRMKLFIAKIVPYLFIITSLVVLLYFYMRWLKIDYGPYHLKIIVTLILGTWAGLFTGTTVGLITARHKNLGGVLGIAVPLLLGFLSGMMANQVSQKMMSLFPQMIYFNPIAMIARNIYVLNSLMSMEVYYQGLLWLACYTLFMLTISLYLVRRDQYDRL